MGAKHLTIGSDTIDLQDIRVSVGEDAPNNSDGIDGDIYLQKNQLLTDTTHNWTYWYRPDGLVEMWKVYPFSTSAGTWGSNGLRVIDNKLSTTERTYPITFASKPSVSISCHNHRGWVYSSIGTDNTSSTTRAPNCGVISLENTTPMSGYVCYHVIGVPA